MDKTGKLLIDYVIYIHEGNEKKSKAIQEVEKLIDALDVEYIAIGDGTYGRETLAFIEENIPQIKSWKVKATMISEAGASVYSASEAAIEEFPKKDVTVRGAVSIARRFQDPLSELVKIDPKSIGVGQYQHDINQVKLKKSLENVVEDCVNYVGVDLNTASYHILAYVSGVGAGLAKSIIKHRDKNGRFSNRKELLSVGRFSEKVFEQAAGFLRIYDGNSPLDSTFVHPERYSVIDKWCKQKSVEIKDLLTKTEIQLNFKSDLNLKKELGEHTFNDIINSLTAPSQDPRTEFKSTEFSKNIKNLEDVKVGEWYTGVVNNITNFGAFVNIGIKESGLVHISQLSNQFVEDPLKVVKVGQEIKVRVVEVDIARKRLALSCKQDASMMVNKKRSSDVGAKNLRPTQPKGNAGKKPDTGISEKMVNNPFSVLKNFKLK